MVVVGARGHFFLIISWYWWTEPTAEGFCHQLMAIFYIYSDFDLLIELILSLIFSYNLCQCYADFLWSVFCKNLLFAMIMHHPPEVVSWFETKYLKILIFKHSFYSQWLLFNLVWVFCRQFWIMLGYFYYDRFIGILFIFFFAAILNWNFRFQTLEFRF